MDERKQKEKGAPNGAFATSHTPGPWRIEFSERMYSDAARIRGDDTTVAVVNADDTAEIEDGAIAEVLSPTAKANAKLIAAAPEMADLLLEQWNIEQCQDDACGEHGQITRILRLAGRLP